MTTQSPPSGAVSSVTAIMTAWIVGTYAGSDRKSAAGRIARLRSRPQFISHENDVSATRNYLKEVCPGGNFTFLALPFPNHTDAWVLRDIPERKVIREWFRKVLKNTAP